MLFTAAVEVAAAEDVELRRTLPWNFPDVLGVIHSDEDDNSERQALMSRVVELVQRVVADLPFDAAADQIVRRFMHERLPPASLHPVPTSAAEPSVDISGSALVRLTHQNCLRMCIEEGSAAVYSCINNSRYVTACVKLTIPAQANPATDLPTGVIRNEKKLVMSSISHSQRASRP